MAKKRMPAVERHRKAGHRWTATPPSVPNNRPDTGGCPDSSRWILDADLAAAFDRIGHDHLMSALGGFPAWALIEQWLKASVLDRGRFAPTEEGTPQGGVISPVLMNVALHGLEQPAGTRYFADDRKDAGKSVPGTPVVVRYADGLLALCVSAEQAQQVNERLPSWLAPRGLAFNDDKTRVVSLDRGFDFLGFNVRRYRNGKLLIKPSKEAVRRIRKRLAAGVKAPARGQRRGGDHQAQPDHPGLGRLLPERGVQGDVLLPGSLRVAAHLQGGPTGPIRTSRGAGSSPGTSACSTRPDGTAGCSMTATAADTWSSSPERESSGTKWSPAARLRTTAP
jgi:Reverse transcriptase (RNA-dependent DNA polymerase)